MSNISYDSKKEALQNQIFSGYFNEVSNDSKFESALLKAFELENHPRAHDIYLRCVFTQKFTSDFYCEMFAIMWSLAPSYK